MPDFNDKQRQALANKGQAMPQGGFPIRNRSDLKRAIQAFGRAKNPAAAKAWIIKRAKELGFTDLLPDDWTAVKHIQTADEFLAHHGIKGMKWGVRKDDAVLGRIASGGRSKIAGETKEDKARYKEYKKSTSRKDRRADTIAANSSRINYIIDLSMKHPMNFVKVGTPGYPTLMQGKEFVDYLAGGGYLNPITTEVTNYVLKPEKSKA